ncbi:MAG TPA: pyruvate dehydrogenase (acetyl-transferring) E1 component subunit alpha [Anaerolineae bacterium]|nr:pyruvate dehydrogenase (acetyl-transferring) E1 component subunit alpha [Anaerolineae bacterium]
MGSEGDIHVVQIDAHLDFDDERHGVRHGHCLAKGGDPKAMMAELLGRATGYCKGKGGSMHIADIELGILGANGIVGGGIGIATGAAYTSIYRGMDRVVICFFGDGAINQGIFYEAANMAALWKLPVIYLCEENQYAEFSPSRPMMSVEDLTVRAVAFGMPGVAVDGNDVLAVHKTVSQAVARARRGEGPSLIIARTYRLEGHTVGDPLTYRPKGEAEEWWARDPIPRFRQYLIEQGVLTEEEAVEIEDAARTEILEAVEFALKSPPPSVDELWRDVYVEM